MVHVVRSAPSRRGEPFAHVEITAKNGVIQQSNFNDYPVARITEAPYQTTVHIVETSVPPAGVGEPGVPPSGPREGARWSPRRGRVSLAEWPYA